MPVRGWVERKRWGCPVFVRIWFLYLCKVAALAMCVAAVGMFLNRPLLLWVSIPVIVPLMIVSVVMAFSHFALRRPMACPHCGGPSTLVGSEGRFGIECENCGVLSVNTFTDFRFRVDPAAPPPVNDESGV